MKWKDVWQQKTFCQKQYSVVSQFRKIIKIRFIYRLAIILFFLVAFFILSSLALFAWYAKDLPQPDKVVRRRGFATKIYDREGVLLYDVFSGQRRTPVNLEDIPQHLRNATIAIEDKNFYKHRGFDPKGILRAIYNICLLYTSPSPRD